MQGRCPLSPCPWAFEAVKSADRGGGKRGYVFVVREDELALPPYWLKHLAEQALPLDWAAQYRWPWWEVV